LLALNTQHVPANQREVKNMNTAATLNGAETFESHRPRLFAIAYRMLGIRGDAEDVVQDAYLRWHQSGAQEIKSPLAFLITVTKRLCLDRLREVKQLRATFVDTSLPEPVAEDHAPTPEAQLEMNQELSAGFLLVLERLGPAERTALLLHDVFDYDYQELARILCKSEQCCRQVLHRARERLREPRARFRVAPESLEHQRMLRKFLSALATGDRRAIVSLLADLDNAGRGEFAIDSDQAIVGDLETANDPVMDPAASRRPVQHLRISA
jgi:RNA polymerase sigma-70 factor (ECF subfamily)